MDVEENQFKDQLTPADDFAPKARKPYTITKQRERWSEEEHKRFLEALKLYGRAWRKIEEHVGSKTAVQIRSHAQKFFCKVIRDSSAGDADTGNLVEIPPPRPKRKPMHPYPRKLVSLVRGGILLPEKPMKPLLASILEQDNPSPKSILSAEGSDESDGVDSCLPDHSPSSASSPGIVSDHEVPIIHLDEVVYSQHEVEDELSSLDEQNPLELVLSSQTTEEPNQFNGRYLKLFGQTLCVTEPSLLPVRVIPLKFIPMDHVNPQTTEANPANACSPEPFPWLTLNINASYVISEEHSSAIYSYKKAKEGRRMIPALKLRKCRSANSSYFGKGFMPYRRCSTEQSSPV